jgi:5-methyltetrahydrofolate--homocysteine methyltransferase
VQIPLLIGGATTSRMHTAVKIDPAYDGTVIYVLDASRSVPVCQSLMDPANAADFAEEIREEYDQLRAEFYAGLEDRKYVDLAVAQERKFKVCCKQATRPLRCRRLCIFSR